MSLTSGQVGNAVVGSDHVGWVCKYLQVKPNIINQALLNSILSGNFQSPIVRVYSEDASSGALTEIEGISFISIRNNKRSRKATWSATLKPERLGDTFTNLYENELPANNTKYFVVRAGYILNGQEILTPVLKGIIKDRTPSYGRAATSINFSGFDFFELLDQVSGTYTGYNSAKSLITYVMNLAGLNSIDFSGFTDFAVNGIDFNQNTGLEVLERLSSFRGEFTSYFTGAGVLVVKDLPSDQDVKYQYQNSTLMGYTPSSSSRDKVTEVVVTGTNIGITRQTDSADKAKFGTLQRENLQNSIITTQAEAETAADNIIDESRKDRGFYRAVFNPFLYIDDIIETFYQIPAGLKYRVEGLTHTFQATENTLSARSNIQVETVEFTEPTKITV